MARPQVDVPAKVVDGSDFIFLIRKNKGKRNKPVVPIQRKSKKKIHKNS